MKNQRKNKEKEICSEWNDIIDDYIRQKIDSIKRWLDRTKGQKYPDRNHKVDMLMLRHAIGDIDYTIKKFKTCNIDLIQEANDLRSELQMIMILWA